MTVKYVTHDLTTGNITVMGHVEAVMTVRGSKVSRIGAIVGQEAQNPAEIHLNLEVDPHKTASQMLVLSFSPQDAVEIGLQLAAMGVEDNPAISIDSVKQRLMDLLAELDRTLQVKP
ncbi:hypothetical protein ACN4EG_07340 [Alkalinema pantanalense CENA528]|uniref:hypothetical protein n=1 Tax=Alkalinema pantanalense TaxID=1620705 RepID=UPI003D6F47BA